MPAVEWTVHINRTPRDVFAFVSDYGRDPTWRSEVMSMTYQNPGPTGVGRLVLEKSRVFGQQLETMSEVIEYEPEDKIVSRSISGPTPVISYRRVTPEAGGTRFAYRLEVDLSKSWFFRLLRPILMPRYKKTFESYLTRLKQILESQA